MTLPVQAELEVDHPDQVFTVKVSPYCTGTCTYGAPLLVQVVHLIALSQLGVSGSYFKTCQKLARNLIHNYEIVGHVLLLQIYLPVGNRQEIVEKYSTFLDLFLSCPGQGI